MVRRTNEKYSLPKEHTVLVNLMITLGILSIATATAFLLFCLLPESYVNIYLFYILALILISRYTNGYIYGIVSSFLSILFINCIFTYPYFEINFVLSGYPLTFAIMLTVTLMICTMTSHMSEQGKIIKKHESQLREAELEQMRANLLRAVSHDLRTPLTGIIGNSANYLDNNHRLTEKDKNNLVQSIYNDSNWLLNMVENLLTVTRIQGDNLQISTNVESVEEVVAESLMRLKKRFPDMEINVKVPIEVLLLPMDAILIEQVIINLVENAIFHSGSDKPIDLIVTDHPTQVSFLIKDYGHGIPTEKLPSLFESGTYRCENLPDLHKGMGIGLSICKTIITAHHGEIYGENHDSGAQFCFYLPKGKIKNES